MTWKTGDEGTGERVYGLKSKEKGKYEKENVNSEAAKKK
jgi:hypothetical protein